MRKQLRPRLRPVNAGYAKLSALFDAAVRARAVSYAVAHVEVATDTEQLLAARVRGTEEYRAAFARAGDTLRYGCSCPYFSDRYEGCKHLWALVLHAVESQLVEGADSAKRFTPSLLPWVTSGRAEDDGEFDDEEYDDEEYDDEEYDDEEYDDEIEELVAPADATSEGTAEESSLVRLLQAQVDRIGAMRGAAGRRSAGSSNWRSLDVASSTEVAELELVYLLAPDSGEYGDGEARFELLLGQRPLRGDGAERARSLSPACALDPRALAHAADRQLFAMLQGLRVGSDQDVTPYGYSYALPSHLPRGYWHVVRVSGWALRPVLELIADTGRGHLAPAGLALQKNEAWREFKRGVRNRQRGRAAAPDYSAFLAWPVLERDTGDSWELELRLEPSSSRRTKAQVYSILPKLVRGDETLSADLTVLDSASGTALVENRLVSLHPCDARWLTSLRGSRGHFVPADEVPDFARLAFGKNGVSRFALPAGYVAEAASQPPRKRLELLSPGPRATDGEVYFEYGPARVRADDPGRLVFLPDRRVLPRDLEFESGALGELESLGFRPKSGNPAALRAAGFAGIALLHVSVANEALAGAVQGLIGKGWDVYGEGKRYRSLESFDIEFESGVDWFGLNGRARFSDSPSDVPFPRLLQALKDRRRVVELGDGSRGLLPDEWAARFEPLAKLVPNKKEELRFSARQLGMLELLCSAVPEASGAEALDGLRRTLDRFQRVEPRKAPRGFRGELRQYQEVGLGWLHAVNELGFGACLADDMGLGKTIQVLSYLYAVHRDQEPARTKGAASKQSPRRSLVVVPRSLLGNWLEEARRFAPDLRVKVHWGPERGEPGSGWGAGDDAAEIILTTYGTLRLDAADLAKQSFEVIVLDEAQAIKNESSATARAAKLLRGKRRIAMSGTPVENHTGELWSLFEFLNPGLLGELPGLERAIGRARPSPEACDLIRRAVRPFILRRTKREVAKDLPDRIEQTLYVDLEKSERARYDELARHYRARVGKKLRELGPERSTPHVLEALLRLRQAACHGGLLDPSRTAESSAKVDLLLEQLRSVLSEGHKALVFSQFTSLLAIVRRKLEEERMSFEYLDGKTSDRAERVERFQTDPSVSVFLISLKAGGVGLNLTAADYVFILDPWWNPAVEAQAIDRAHRIGQKRTVIAYRLLARGTVEERVAELQARKRELVESLMGEGSLSAKLTRADLEALLELGS